MSSKYKVRDQTRLHFVTYATVGWADVFTRTPTGASMPLSLVRKCARALLTTKHHRPYLSSTNEQ